MKKQSGLPLMSQLLPLIVRQIPPEKFDEWKFVFPHDVAQAVALGFITEKQADAYYKNGEMK